MQRAATNAKMPRKPKPFFIIIKKKKKKKIPPDFHVYSYICKGTCSLPRAMCRYIRTVQNKSYVQMLYIPQHRYTYRYKKRVREREREQQTEVIQYNSRNEWAQCACIFSRRGKGLAITLLNFHYALRYIAGSKSIQKKEEKIHFCPRSISNISLIIYPISPLV